LAWLVLVVLTAIDIKNLEIVITKRLASSKFRNANAPEGVSTIE
jgi:hypothetical protein